LRLGGKPLYALAIGVAILHGAAELERRLQPLLERALSTQSPPHGRD
jgi:hypothetical protein